MGAPCKYVYFFVCPDLLILGYFGFYVAESFLEIFVGTFKLKLGLHCYTDD